MPPRALTACKLLAFSTFALAPMLLGADRLVATCGTAADQREIDKVVAEIARATDPCGETPELLGLLREFRRCRGYQICVDRESERNLIEMPGGFVEGGTATIRWNPDLSTELERGCDRDPAVPVLRDPAASLLHEMAHAVQLCRGLDPSEHELEAVRIENIYRRAHSLCQRGHYGDQSLPSRMILSCDRDRCGCRTRSPSSSLDESPLSTSGL